jgi:uncharacterized cupin superfamily protein
MTSVEPFQPIAVGAAVFGSDPVPDEARLAGTPRTGWIDLARVGGAVVGIWEMTAGAMRDIEADEVFVVVAGRASVELVEGGRTTRTIELVPGTLCRLDAGMHTRWRVTETLRKVYVVADPEATS